MAGNLEDNLRKGPWEEDEDELLKAVVERIGEGRWDSLAQASGLLRSGKSCRLRWLNYLRPNLKRGKISVEEEAIIIQLQQQWGNKWSKIAKMLPGRTDNELKNYWRTRIRKQQSQSRKLEIHANRSMSFEQESSIAGTFESLGINGGNQEFSDEKIPDGICAQTASISETNSFGLGVGSCSDFGMAYSPYEARLENWVSDFSDNKYASKDQMEATLGIGYESCDVSEECFYSLWDSYSICTGADVFSSATIPRSFQP